MVALAHIGVIWLQICLRKVETVIFFEVASHRFLLCSGNWPIGLSDMQRNQTIGAIQCCLGDNAMAYVSSEALPDSLTIAGRYEMSVQTPKL